MAVEETLVRLESDTLFLGILFFIYVIAGDIIFDKPKQVVKYFKNSSVVRHLVIFSSAFLITQNFKQSVLIWIGYTFLFDGLLDCNSKFSILPAECKKSINGEELKVVVPPTVIQKNTMV